MTSLTHIAPQLPPAIDGVGDYCWNLWRHWPEENPDWKFLVARNAKATSAHWPEVIVNEFTSEKFSLAESLEQSDCEIAVLHYVGYGFQPKGIPIWLPGEIERWKRADSRRRFVTMFHEMDARSSPVRSPFWVAPIARHIIGQLVRLSDAWVTSCERYFDQLTTDFGANSGLGHIIPIGSNIPYVALPPGEWRGEKKTKKRFRFVVFGLARTRLWALERHWKLLRAVREADALESITLLGAREGTAEARARERLASAIGGDLKWNAAFDLPASEVSEHLAGHDFGLLANEPDIVTKSGVFAALAEHGVIPIISTREHQSVPRALATSVIPNSEQPDHIKTTLEFLRDTARLQQMRDNLREFAAKELAWPRIASSWRAALRPFFGARSQAASHLQLQPVVRS